MSDEPATKRDIERLDSKIDGVDAKIDGVENKVDATRKDLDIVARQVAVLTNEVSAIRGDMSSMQEQIVAEIGRAAAQTTKVITELVASNVTMVDEKYNHLPDEVRQNRDDLDEHCQDAQAHSKH